MMTDPPSTPTPTPPSATRSSIQNDRSSSTGSSANDKVYTYTSHFKTQKDQELIRLALHNSPFFSCLDEEQVERLVDTAQLKTYRRGEIVILEGCVDDDNDDQSTTEEVHSSNQGEIEMDTVTTGSSSSSSITPPTKGYETDISYDDPAEADADDFTDEEDESEKEDAVPLIEEERDQASFPDRPNKNGVSSEDEKPNSEHENDTLSPCKPEVTVVNDVASAHSSPPDLPLLSSTSPTLGAEKEQTQTSSQQAYPPPPRSGIPRSIYIIRKGLAGIWFQPNFNPASLGPGSLFGEGGFLFGRQHSASVVAADDTLECWVLDHDTFRNHVLPSTNVKLFFQSHAKHKDETTGEPYMTMDEFVQAITELRNVENGNGLPSSGWDDSMVSLRIANTYSILRRQQAGTNNGLLSSVVDPRIQLSDFAFFQFLMARPDPEIDIAFLLMDEKQTGQIYLADLAKFLQPAFPDLDLTSQFFQRYFGKEGQNYSIRPTHFSQFLADLQREMGKQAFLRAVEEHGTTQGYLNPTEFLRILGHECGWRLPSGVTQRLHDNYCHNVDDHDVDVVDGDDEQVSHLRTVTAATASTTYTNRRRNSNTGKKYFAYGDFLAFQEVLGNLPFICNLIDSAQMIKKGPVSPDDFKVANRVQGLGGRFSRRQVEIVFNLFDLDQDGYISFEDTVTVCGVDYARRLVPVKGRGDKLTFAPPPQYRHNDEPGGTKVRTPAEKVTAGIFQLGIAAAVGGLGVGLLYPIDFVKTRLMNQRIALDGSRMYRSSLDCIQQAFRAEGLAGMYRGLLPALLGVAPERAIKLQVHNLLIHTYSFDEHDDNNSESSLSHQRPSLWVEALAGGCAGASQLLVTNPIELAKIRLQLQGETSRLLVARGIAPPPSSGFIEVIRDLGFPGIYRGASACLLRDIPFSAIYFPAYAACRDALSRANSITGAVTSFDILLAGTIAAVPAALVTTPADVIKTRLQAVPRPGELNFLNLANCATQMYRREGIKAFFQGSLARTLRIAPQFGISMLAYEGLAELFSFQRASRPPTNLPVDPRDYQEAFASRNLEGYGYFGNFLRRTPENQS